MTQRRALTAAAIALPLAAIGGPAAAQSFPDEIEAVDLCGLNAGDNFGKSAAGAGDLDDDGFDDVAVGAPFADGAATACGSVLVYFGGAAFFDDAPDLTLDGTAADDQFGSSVAGGFDFDGDGVDDLAVGARLHDLGAEDGGAVFIFSGGGPAAFAALPAEAGDDWFGNSVGAAGDVNGDGFDDVVVGAPYNDDGANAGGKAYVYLGAAAEAGIVEIPLLGAGQSNAHFGWSVAGAGDVNGDGFDDVVVGARLYGNGPFQARGRAYVFFGGDPMDTTADVIMEGGSANDWFGESVAGAGDVDGDGFDDVVVGAVFADPAGSASGAALLFFGGNPMDATADFQFDGPHADAQLGNAVAGAGDLDGDGFDELLAGAHFADAEAGTAAGRVFVLLGAADPGGITELSLGGAAANDQFGESVAGAGAVTGTGPPAFVAGAHFNDAAGEGAGKAWVARLAAGTVPGDLDGDGMVGVTDFLALLAAWGPCPAPCPPACPADLDGDCTVGTPDLLALLSSWG